MLNVSVVICCYTEARWDDLRASVASVERQTESPRDVAVVVDHNPRLFARVRAEIPHVLAFENQQERGLSGGRNTGVAVTRGAVVAFLDDDAVAEPDWLAALVAGYSDKRVLGVGGRIEPLWLAERPGWFPDEFNWVVGCSYRGLPLTASPVRNLIGANMSFRRDVLAQIGGFRADLGYVGTQLRGNEETELCIRARQRRPGSVLLYEPRARVHHRVPASRTRWQYFGSRCYAEGLAKSQTANLVGVADGLSSERVHVTRTLPRGLLRGVSDGIFHGQPAGFGRAAAIAAGLAVTTAGYVVGSAEQAWAARSRGAEDALASMGSETSGPAEPVRHGIVPSLTGAPAPSRDVVGV